MTIIISLILLGIGASVLYLMYQKNLSKLELDIKNNNRKELQELEQIHKNNLIKEEENYKLQLKDIESQHNLQLKELETQQDKIKYEFSQYEKDIEREKQLLYIELTSKQESIQSEIETYKQHQYELTTQSIENDKKAKEQVAIVSLNEFIELIETQKQEYQSQLDEIAASLEEYKSKQAAVNEEVRRKRELEQKQDSYRLKLTEFQRQDISYLLSIVENLKNPQILYKLIWSEYLQKPFAAMIKNEFGANEPRCVIYKITNLKTQESYIGRTKGSVSDRWTSHIKTSLNIGTAARSAIHDALFGHWGNFVFEVLEEVEDESKLGEREKFYISFYQTDKYGYNQNQGG